QAAAHDMALEQNGGFARGEESRATAFHFVDRLDGGQLDTKTRSSGNQVRFFQQAAAVSHRQGQLGLAAGDAVHYQPDPALKLDNGRFGHRAEVTVDVELGAA